MSENNNIPPIQQIAAQDIHAGGNVSFGDINQTIVQSERQPDLNFLEITENKDLQSNFEKLLIEPELIDQFFQNRFLVLSGDHRIDKSTYARCLAFCLSSRLNDGDEKPIVKEWCRTNPQSIDIEFQRTKKTTIFILTQVSNQSIGYNLYRIRKALSDRHYVVISTDHPFESWNLPQKERNQFWHILNDSDVQKVNEFTHISEFKYLINEFNEEDLENWYSHELSINEQLIALGLCFFNGLFDDQFFAAIEEIAEKIKSRDQSLRAPDYIDLEKMHRFFTFTETISPEIKKIEIRFSQERFMLLSVVWKTHQRLIRNVLPTLVSLAKNSARSSKGELYCSNLRRSQLRKEIAETISNIGLISRDSVEESLSALAADNSIKVQEVAAYAMARWREYKIRKPNAERMLFDTLHRWQYENKDISLLVAKYMTGDSQEQSKQPVDYIRATVALTVGYASLYDEPNCLKESLCNLLKTLIEDSNKLVRNRLRDYTLPEIISRHFKIIHSLICETAQKSDIDLIVGISSGLARAYQQNPGDISTILERWQEPEKHNLLTIQNTQDLSAQYSLIATAALAYGKIEYDTISTSLTIRSAFNHLENIFKENQKSSLVRGSVLEAVAGLGLQDIQQFERQLRRFVENLKTNEREIIIILFLIIYLEQRKLLKNGDAEIEIDDVKYQVWTGSVKRPLTDIESIILNWLKDETYPSAQQIAVQTMLAFAKKFNRIEKNKIEELKNQNQSELVPLNLNSNEKIDFECIESDFYTGILIPWLITRTKQEYRKTIRNLLPEISKHYRSCRELVEFIFFEWSHSTDKEVLEISRLLQDALNLSNILPQRISIAVGVTTVTALISATVVGMQISPHRVQAPQPPIEPVSTQSTPLPSDSPEPPVILTPEPTISTSTHSSDEYGFPKEICGDPFPSPDEYPITLYPVFVKYSDTNYQTIKEKYCKDAISKKKQDKIQVASFKTREKAEKFSEFLKEKINSGWVGKESRIEKDAPNLSSFQSKISPLSPSPVIPKPSPNFNSDYICKKPKSENYIDGLYEIEWKIGNNDFKGRLQMQGSSGIMIMSYIDIENQNYKTVEQAMELQSCSFGAILSGSNPVDFYTKEQVLSYSPDNIYIQVQPDDSIIIFNIDDKSKEKNVSVPVEIRKISN